MNTRTPRTGRRPGANDTREAILAAARRLFAERGYNGASMRAIAAAAGVDAALIVHFFGTKAQLLIAATAWPFDPAWELPGLLADPERVGERLARLFVGSWDRAGSGNPLITLLRAATTEPAAADLLAEFLRVGLLGPLVAGLGSDQPELRSNLVAAQVAGVALVRYILGFEPLVSADAEQVVQWVGPALQRYLTGSLG